MRIEVYAGSMYFKRMKFHDRGRNVATKHRRPFHVKFLQLHSHNQNVEIIHHPDIVIVPVCKIIQKNTPLYQGIITYGNKGKYQNLQYF